MLEIVFYGDIVGKPGRKAFAHHVPLLRDRYPKATIVANGENASGGIGLDSQTADEIFHFGAHVVTTGNHVWQKKDLLQYLDNNRKKIIRPANFPPGNPGSGWTTLEVGEHRLCFINLIGRVFMPQFVDCPFRTFDELWQLPEVCSSSMVFVDFHAEATSEKVALGHYLDGRATVVVGTHTHVQTADDQILPKGTAYISDVGMCGVKQSVIGFSRENVVNRFLWARPTPIELEKGEGVINAVYIRYDALKKRVEAFERLMETVAE